MNSSYSYAFRLQSQSTSLSSTNPHSSNGIVPTTAVSIDHANNASTTSSTANTIESGASLSQQQVMPPLPDMKNLDEEQITALSADTKLTHEGHVISRNEGDTKYYNEESRITSTRNLQSSEQERKRVERNRRERILSKQRRQQRNEENRQMTEKIRILQFSNDEIKAKIDDLFKELQALLPPEKLEEVKEALSKHNFTSTGEISSSLINDNEELQKKINTISEELSSFLPTSEEDEEQEDEVEEQSMQESETVDV